jgi:flagellar biosynthesis protein FliR
MELFPPGTLEAFSLYLLRTSALVIASPVLGSQSGFAGPKIGLVVGVAFLLYATGGAPLDHAPLPVEYVLLALREVLIGLFLAFTLQAVLVAVRVAGELIGHEMGFNMAQIVDPTTGIHTPVLTQIYELFFFLGFLAADGHHLLLRSLDRSFAHAPVGTFDLSGNLAWIAQGFFAQMFTAGISFAAPVMVLLTLTSLLIGLLARAVPQLNVMEVGFTARIGVGLLAMLAFAPLLGSALGGLYRHFSDGLETALLALGA